MRCMIVGLVIAGFLGMTPSIFAESPDDGGAKDHRDSREGRFDPRGSIVRRDTIEDHREDAHARHEDVWDERDNPRWSDRFEERSDRDGGNASSYREDQRTRREGRWGDRGGDRSQQGPVAEEVQRLRKLRDENPEVFQKEIQERKAQLRQRLSDLKERDPKAFQRAKGRLLEQRQHRLEELRQTDPERFREEMEQRRSRVQERLEDLKSNHPERYEELMRRRDEWREHQLEQLRRDRPEAHERFLERHPHWQERMESHGEHIREGGEQSRGRWDGRPDDAASRGDSSDVKGRMAERFRHNEDGGRGDFRHQFNKRWNRSEDMRDRGEGWRDVRENARDHREDRWDARHEEGWQGQDEREKEGDDRDDDEQDRGEEHRGWREGRRDFKEDVQDKREDRRDWQEHFRGQSGNENENERRVLQPLDERRSVPDQGQGRDGVGQGGARRGGLTGFWGGPRQPGGEVRGQGEGEKTRPQRKFYRENGNR